MLDLPFSYTIPVPGAVPSRIDNHIVRTLSSLKGQFLDQAGLRKNVGGRRSPGL